jgi:hypothetical protein
MFYNLFIALFDRDHLFQRYKQPLHYTLLEIMIMYIFNLVRTTRVLRTFAGAIIVKTLKSLII